MRINATTNAELEDWGPLELPLADPLDAVIATRGVQSWASEDEKTSTGIWECEPGRSRWDMEGEGEFIHVISGSMVCTPDGGEAVTLRAGDSMTFAPGWKGEWNITETLRKVYVIFPG
jgi:uncharacterized cupin superfamily protein